MAKFSEHDVGLPSRYRDQTCAFLRLRALAAHLLGYVGAPDDTNKDEAKKFTFIRAMWTGNRTSRNRWTNTCAETGRALSPAQCQGHDRWRSARGSSAGRGNVVLTLDARIQMITEEALRSVGRAAAVVVDPNNGNILAMASVPSFDPNTFIPSIKAKDWDAPENEANPLINRAVSAFPPGST
jgi:penicillin-binding protein 2